MRNWLLALTCRMQASFPHSFRGKAMLAFAVIGAIALLAPHPVYAAWFIPLFFASAAAGTLWVAVTEAMNDIALQVWTLIANVLFWLASQMAGVMGLAGSILDLAIEYTITQNPLRELEGIEVAWTIFRDLTNILFIFILLFIAIATIVGLHNYGIKTLLARFVIVALLVNFSLFFVQFAYDASNLLSINLYNQLTIDDSQVSPVPVGAIERESLSFIFIGALGFDQIYTSGEFNALFEALEGAETLPNNDESDSAGGGSSEDNDSSAKDRVGVLSKITGFALILIALFGITAWVFFRLAIIFVARVVAFIILMIIAPLAFITAIIPTLKGRFFDQWGLQVIKQALVAPFIMVILFTTAILAEALAGDLLTSFIASENAAASGGATDALDVSTYLNFLIIIGLLVAAYKIVLKFSDTAGALGMEYSNKALGYAGGAFLGTTGFAGRQLIGGAAHTIRESRFGEYLRNKSANAQFGIGRFAARNVHDALSSTAKRSFDARSIKPIGQATKQAGIDLGENRGEGGYEKSFDESVKRDVAREKKRTDMSAAGEEAFRKESMPQADQRYQSEVANKQQELTNAQQQYAQLNQPNAGASPAQIVAADDKVQKVQRELNELQSKPEEQIERHLNDLKKEAVSNRQRNRKAQLGRGVHPVKSRGQRMAVGAQLVKKDDLSDAVKKYVEQQQGQPGP